MKLRRIILPLALLLLAPCFAWGQEQKLDVKGIVLGHLADSYEWHITNVGKRAIAIPLPVIVWGHDGAWRLFLSSRFEENGGSYQGLSIAEGGDHAGKIVEADGSRPRLDISLTKTSLAIVINSAVLLLLVLPLARWYRRGKVAPPKGMRGAVEMLAEYVDDEVLKPCLGEENRKYTPLLLTFFFFIFVNNMMGLIPFFPGGATVTGNIAVTVILALVTFLVVNFSGTKEYWKEVFWPEVPVWLKVPAPIMPAIEVFGLFTKPFALTIRLFANIFAGHAVILAMVCVIFITAPMGAGVNGSMTVVSVIFSIFMFCMELLVGFIQAYVFTLLSAVFISLAKVKHENHNH